MEEFIAHIFKLVSLSQNDISLIETSVETKSFSKKELLLETGDKADKIFFVSKGCLRMLFLSDEGIEVTTQFAIENWWLGDLLGFHNDTESAFSIQATEKSEIVILKKPILEKLSADPRQSRTVRSKSRNSNATSGCVSKKPLAPTNAASGNCSPCLRKNDITA